MKFLIITYDEYINIPYIKNYEQAILNSGNTYDVILWNRRNIHNEYGSNFFEFSCSYGKSKFGKVIPFILWRRFVLNVIKKGNYDRLIVLTTIPAVLIANKLIHNFKGKFWLDIRDFTFENIGIYKKIVGKLAKEASVCSISSEAFKSFLPESTSTELSHNVSNLEHRVSECNLRPDKQQYNIGFVGGIRYPEQNKALISALAGNAKYKLIYRGKVHKGCELEAFCKKRRISNVEFYPEYDNYMKPEIYKSIDLINSIYRDNSPVEKLALPNRLYDCILFKKPIIVSDGTFLAEQVKKYNLGLAVNLKQDDLVRKIDEYIANFDKQEFEKGCNKFLDKALAENSIYMNKVNLFCAGR